MSDQTMPPRFARRGVALVALAAVCLAYPDTGTAEPPAAPVAEAKAYAATVEPFLKQHCTGCHSGAKPKAGFDLTKLSADLAGADAKQWQAVLEQVQSGEMPPKNNPRPPASDVARVTTRLKAGLKGAAAHPRVTPADGNRVAHADLFGAPAEPGGASPPRVWRISPYAYTEFVASIAGKPDPKKPVPQPFAGLSENGFKDYAAAFTVDEPTTQQLYRNAKDLVARQTAAFKGDNFPKNGPDAVLGPLFGPEPTRGQVEAAVRHQFRKAIKRDPDTAELAEYADLLAKNIRDAGADGARAGLAAVLVHPEAIFRSELGSGPADAHGRRMLVPRELAVAVGYALTDKGPDAELLKAAESGKLSTPAEVAAHVRRLLAAGAGGNPRVLRFFQEYFGYPAAADVFKDLKENPDHKPDLLVKATDQLVLHVLATDKDVFRELLTTNVSFVPPSGKNDGKLTAGTRVPKLGPYTSFNLKEPPAQQPMRLPMAQRAGVLTQPSWLAAYSLNTENHPILRGKWVRERLLGGHIPDLPITVDAQLPDDPKRTLRQRMEVTREAYCWGCHRKMNDLGLAFEMFDHFGRFRTAEALTEPPAAEAPKKGAKPAPPVARTALLDSTGLVADSGDPKLDGPVTDALDLIRKLAASERVEQVFVRHAFRYWMGRNETPADAYTLQQAHKAYKDSGGSMKALIASLLTSEAFLYRR